jgi:hypothetical protein
MFDAAFDVASASSYDKCVAYKELVTVEVPISTIVQGSNKSSYHNIPHPHSDRELTTSGFVRHGDDVYLKRAACVDVERTNGITVCTAKKDIVLTTVVHKWKRYIDDVNIGGSSDDKWKTTCDGSQVRVVRYFE